MQLFNFISVFPFLATALLQAGKGVHGQPDPCSSATQLPNLNKRLIGQGDGSPILSGDYYLNEGWYSMGSYVITKSDKDCGAIHPWHRDGDLPVNLVETALTVCDRKCTDKKTIRVKMCSKDMFVFKLLPLDSNDMGYCIESLNPAAITPDLTAPIIHFAAPTISAEVRRINGNNNLHFYCDFVPTDTKLVYTVEWAVTSVSSIVMPIVKIESVQFDKDFKLKTALNEDHLKHKNLHRLGITILCSVSAQNDAAGTHSNAIQSGRKFCGIEVLDKGLINLKTNNEATIRLRSTVPFGCNPKQITCSLNVNVFYPATKGICELPSLGILKSARDPCGVTIHSNKYNEIQTFKLKRKSGGRMGRMNRLYVLQFTTEKQHPDHPLFANYALQQVRVNVETDTSKINGKECYSHNDPHMMTFGGSRYENQTPGKYVLYKHKKYPLEVQLWTYHYTATIALNCGIVVRAGRDVFVYSTCEKRTEINFRICDDSILHRRVKEIGNNYEVYLPTGTIIVIQRSGSQVNFQVKPSVADIGDTDGLCGSLDKPGLIPDPSKYRVTKANDLFDSKHYKSLQSWSVTEFLCKCEQGAMLQPNNELENSGICDASLQTTCNDDRSKLSHLNNVCALARRKRHVPIDGNADVWSYYNSTLYDWNDNHADPKTDFIGKTNSDSAFQKGHEVLKRMVYDDVTAKRDCMEILNTTAFQKCSNLPHIDVAPYVHDCILDAKVTGSMNWAGTHLEAIKHQCIYQIRVNQPLSAEAKSELMRSWENETSVNVSQILPTVSTTAVNITYELLKDVSDTICPNECSGHGKCIKGECLCDDGFIDVDCAVDSSQPPVMNGIPDRGLCDKQLRPCKQTSVFGENFVDSGTLKCKITSFTINIQSEINSTESVDVPAESMSIAEVKCPLPTVRQVRDISDQLPNNVVASGYNISISNNGHTFSDADTLVVYDSRCVSCSKDNGRIICKALPGYCVRNGACHIRGEEGGPCDLCDINNAGQLQWIQKQGCIGSTTTDDRTSKPWIIPAVIAPVALMVVLIVVVIYCSSIFTSTIDIPSSLTIATISDTTSTITVAPTTATTPI